MPKNAHFNCDFCNFKCSKQSNWNNHVETKKHAYRVNGNQMETKNAKKCQKMPKPAIYTCICGKKYTTNSGLWKHNKNCILIQQTHNNEIHVEEYKQDVEDNEEMKEFMKYLIKENSEFKHLMLEVIKNGTHNTTNNNNSHNKTFNLQFFLNETCKDAMNIMDFVDSINLQLSDLENVGKLGYVEGISNIIIKNLNNLEVEKRPVHCTDSKREVLYVKDENQWYNDSKEENENKKIRKAIKHITHKNSKILPEFKAKYPDCIYSDSKKSDQYNKIIIESLNDSKENENKIIKKIAKEVVVDK